jgi:hypothetical protein
MQVGLPLAGCVAVACAAISFARARRVKALGPGDIHALVKALGSRDASAIDSALTASDRIDGHGLVREALDAPGATWVGVVNEHLSDAAHALDDGSGVPKAAARISLATGTLLAVLGVASGAGGASSPMAASAGAFAFGLAGALVTLEMGRRADRLAAERRREWDRLSTALSRYLGARLGDIGEGKRKTE